MEFGAGGVFDRCTLYRYAFAVTLCLHSACAGGVRRVVSHAQTVLKWRSDSAHSKQSIWKELVSVFTTRFPGTVRAPVDLRDRWDWIKCRVNKKTSYVARLYLTSTRHMTRLLGWVGMIRFVAAETITCTASTRDDSPQSTPLVAPAVDSAVMLAKCASRVDSVDVKPRSSATVTVHGSRAQSGEDELADSADVNNYGDDDDDGDGDDDGDRDGTGVVDDESRSDDEPAEIHIPSKKRQHQYTKPKITKFARLSAPSFTSKSFGMSQPMLSWLSNVRTQNLQESKKVS
jgi:hypothetical protein